MMQYAALFEQARANELSENRKDGQARRTANMWLVDLLEKINK
jgi:hypothetical protein